MGNKHLEDEYSATARAEMSFEERYDEIVYWIEKRRRNFDIATLEWDDVRQMVLIKIQQQYALYNPKISDFSHWANRVITNALRNIWRDNLSNFSRPCVTGKGGCIYNMGGDQCSQTPSGIQCSECKAFRDWEAKKKDMYAVKMTLSIDSPKHAAEAHNMQSDFMDIEGKKKIIDQKMKEKLSRSDWKMYKLLLIKGLDEREVSKQMGFKGGRGQKKKSLYPGYQIILAAKKKFLIMVKQIIQEESLIDGD